MSDPRSAAHLGPETISTNPERNFRKYVRKYFRICFRKYFRKYVRKYVRKHVRKCFRKCFRKYDGKCLERYIEEFCKYVEISRDEFDKTCEKFRGSMWIQENGEYRNKIHDMLKEIRDKE